LGMAE